MIKKMFSIGAIAGKIADTVRRFPLAVLSIVAGAVLVLLAIHGFEDDINYRWAVFLGFVLTSSVAVTLTLEDRRSWTVTLLASLGVAVLWGARCLFFPADPDDMSDAQWVEVGVVSAAAFGAIFFSAFLRRDNDAQWWNFTLRTLVRLLLGALFSAILFWGFMFAIFAVTELFGANIPDETIGWLAVGCFIVFAPLYVMAGVPRGERKRDPEMRPEPVLKVLALYILGPIMAVYTLILYVYLLMIVVTWELPNGWVSWLVTVLGMGGLVMTLLLYPHRMRGGNRIVDLLGRWTGVVIAPLLVLMTVGIARRVMDYGWTPNRCYILLLNLWFYGVYAWLFVARGRRVKWIVVSAVVVAFLSSVGPWSLARVTPREDAEGVCCTEAEEEQGEWFASDSTLEMNTPQAIGREWDRFARIMWYGHDSNQEGSARFTVHGDELVIGLAAESDGEEEREFRMSLRQLAGERMISGEDFEFIVESFQGIRYEARDSIRVNLIEGYLLYD